MIRLIPAMPTFLNRERSANLLVVWQESPGTARLGGAAFPAPLTPPKRQTRISVGKSGDCPRRNVQCKKGASPDGQLPTLDVNQVGEVTVVRFRDHKIVEDISIQELGSEMFQLVEVENRDKLLLNFSAVDFLSSAALGKLITLDKKVKAHGGVLKLSNIRPEIYEVFTITRLNRLFDIKDDEADALASFEQALAETARDCNL